MRALLLKGPGKPFSIETVNDPIPEKGYAVAKILACGSGLTIQHVKAGRIIVIIQELLDMRLLQKL